MLHADSFVQIDSNYYQAIKDNKACEPYANMVKQWELEMVIVITVPTHFFPTNKGGYAYYNHTQSERENSSKAD
jgi:hypothetical protein